MIIQCDECKAKFKLDDSKVKPEGVKVKCKKCGHVFFVFPHKEEEKDNEKIIETSQQVGLIESLPPTQQEPEKWESDIFAEKPTFEEKEEVREQQEFDWEQFSQELKIEKTESAQEAPVDNEIKFEVEEERKEEVNEETKEESKDRVFVHEEQTDIFETSKFDFTSGDEIKDEQKIDFDFSDNEEKHEEEFLSQHLEKDLLSETGSEFTFEEKKEDTSKKEEEFKFIFEEGETKGDGVHESEGVKEILEIYEEKDKKEESVSGQDIPLQTEDFLAQTPRRFNLVGILLSILIVIIIGGGGTGYMWWQKVKISESLGSIGVTNVKFKYGEAKEPNQIFIVTGKIKNEFNVPKSFLKVKCTVYGKNNTKLMEKVVFAGNIFTEAELKELTYFEIEKGLNNKMGKSMVNVDVPPGKLLDFMIVFDKIPDNAEFIEVEGA